VRHLAQDVRRAPTAKKHVARLGAVQDLLARVEREVVGFHAPAFEQVRRAFKQVIYGAFAHMHALGHVLDHLVLDHLEPEALDERERHVSPARAHLSRHRNHRHAYASPGPAAGCPVLFGV
jgi:hypothetical protein